MKHYPKCPECDGPMRKHGKQITRKGLKQRYQCKKCGRLVTSLINSEK